MEMTAQCVDCLLKRIRLEARMVDPDLEMEVMKACLKDVAGRFGKGINSAATATETHRLAYKMLGTDPYAELKKQSNEVAMKFLPVAYDFVNNSEDKFRAAVLCSIIGNVLDFGINDALDEPGYFASEFENLLEQGLKIDDSQRIRDMIEEGTKIAYLPDNCGEIVLDRLLIEQLKELGAHITLVVKGEAILTDAMVEDAEFAGLVPPLIDEVITTERFAVGLPIYDMPEKLSQTLAEADLVISKGMGNFESLTDLPQHRPVAYLMRIKCRPVAEAADAPLDANICMLVR